VRESQCELTRRRLAEPPRKPKNGKPAPKPIPGQLSLFMEASDA
jgi:hypothetical protein